MRALVSTGCKECLSGNPEDGIAKGFEIGEAIGEDEDISFLADGCFQRKVFKPEENCMKVEGFPR